MTDANTGLMTSIQAQWGAAILDAVKGSSSTPATPAAFLAALVANESGGRADAQRFESATFERLKEVVLGMRPHYSPAGIKRPLTQSDLVAYCDPGVAEERGSFSDALLQLHALATSWGLTQLMGWHLVEFQSGMGVTWLGTGSGNLKFAVQLLGWFAEHYGLDPAADCEKLFTCWNCGEPTGKTFDPNYVANGMARMKIYESLSVEATQ